MPIFQSTNKYKIIKPIYLVVFFLCGWMLEKFHIEKTRQNLVATVPIESNQHCKRTNKNSQDEHGGDDLSFLIKLKKSRKGQTQHRHTLLSKRAPRRQRSNMPAVAKLPRLKQIKDEQKAKEREEIVRDEVPQKNGNFVDVFISPIL